MLAPCIAVGRRSKAERETVFQVKGGARVRFRRSEAPPPYRYAITLESFEDGEWTTIRLWDNADGVDVHHEHAYTRHGGKRPPSLLPFGSPNEAMAFALARAKKDPPEMVRQWRGI